MKRKVINSLLLVFCTHNFKFILLLTQIQQAKYQKVGECHVQEYLAEKLKTTYHSFYWYFEPFV